LRSLREKILTKPSLKIRRVEKSCCPKKIPLIRLGFFFSLKTRIVSAHTSLLILWWNEGDLRLKFGLLGAGK
jgi:hypothetical protein